MWDFQYSRVRMRIYIFYSDITYVISDADITYFIILGLWKWVSATDDEEISENYAVIKLRNEWMKMQLMNEVLRFDVLNNETI